MVKKGLIVFSNESGLGYQTKRLAEMIKPDRLLAIDSSSFSKNKKQHWEWYQNFSGYRVQGFPTNYEIRTFCTGLTHILCVENPLNYFLLSYSSARRIKVFIQSNFEFCDHLNQTLTLPHLFLMPSQWKVKDMKSIFGADRVMYLPPPIDPNEFRETREFNFNMNNDIPKYLHIVGTLAVNDRNGTLDLLRAIQFTKYNFSLTIKSQHPLPPSYMTDDPRVTYQFTSDSEPSQIYKGFDALILPRRYGGLSLPVNEALMSGLPVIMTDISPNNYLLPKKWLVKSHHVGSFMTRSPIDYYSADIHKLAVKLDWLAQNYNNLKTDAFAIAHDNFSTSSLSDKYNQLWT